MIYSSRAQGMEKVELGIGNLELGVVFNTLTYTIFLKDEFIAQDNNELQK
jgi:hypothetical protein